MSEGPHPPGSPRLDALSSHVLEAFTSFGLDHSWTDSHYVGLQRPDRSVWLRGVLGRLGAAGPFNSSCPALAGGSPAFFAGWMPAGR